jgi:hypothetical protein
MVDEVSNFFLLHLHILQCPAKRDDRPGRGIQMLGENNDSLSICPVFAGLRRADDVRAKKRWIPTAKRGEG